MLERDFTFQTLSNNSWFFTVVAAVLAAVTLIVMLARYERQFIPVRVGYVLLALRLATVVVILLTLFEPVLSWQVDKEQTGRIVVAIDLSDSMATIDEHALIAEKLRWARSLGMIGNPTVLERLDDWIVALEENREPEWVADDEGDNASDREAIGAARQDYINDTLTAFDDMSRSEFTRRLLNLRDFSLLDELEDIAEVELRFFAGRSEVVEPDVLEKEALESTSDVRKGESNITSIMAAPSEENRPVRATVVLTDGRHNGRQDPVAVASRMNIAGAPIYPIIIGSTNKPKDIAFINLEYPKATIKGDTTVVKANLLASGFEGEQIEIELIAKNDNGEEVVQQKTVNVNEPAQEVAFELESEEVGRFDYIVRVEPLEEELRDDNNEKSFGINVVDDQSHVMLIEGAPRWEFRFLNNAFERDDRVQLVSVVFDQPYLARLPNTFFRRRLPWTPVGQDIDDTPLAETDLLILGDLPPDGLSQATWKQIDQFVGEAGGTLVFLAGKQQLASRARSPEIARLLPMTNLRPLDLSGQSSKLPPAERGFHLQLTPEGEREDMLRFDIDVNENRQIWSELPGHIWGLLGQPKPGTTVWASAATPGNEVDLKTERERAIIVHQLYGVGQVVWIGIDSTWRWRHRVGDEYHHRFWGQLARWAATNKATAGNEFVKFGPDTTDIDVGQDAIFRARFSKTALKRHPDLKAKVEIYEINSKEADRLATTVELKPIEIRPTIYEGRAVGLNPGNYRAELITTPNIGADIVSPLFVKDRQSIELADLSANSQLLEEIATNSGGKLLHPDEIRQLPDLLSIDEQETQSHEEQSLWDHWLVLTLFFGLLMTEWVLRKLNGLP